MQKFTSSATSINRSKLPAVYGKTTFTAPFVLDYGCGKYIDHIRKHITEQGHELFPYDPYNQPKHVNNATIDRIIHCFANRIPLDVVCSNVLNVIDDDAVVYGIADQIQTIVDGTHGTAYITVYEGDRSGVGRQTGDDQYQRNEPLRNYLKYFRNGTIKHGMIVVGQ